MVWAFVFNTAAYCGSLVAEREKKLKYISNVMGMRKAPYWCANYAFDLMIFLTPLIFFFVGSLAIGDKAKFIIDMTQYLIPLLVLFSFSFIGFSYVFSFIFQKSNTAYKLFPFINLIFFYTIPQLPQYLDENGPICQYVTPMLSPFIAFNNAFFTQEMMKGVNTVKVFHSKSYVYDLICLAVQAVVYLVATLAM